MITIVFNYYIDTIMKNYLIKIVRMFNDFYFMPGELKIRGLKSTVKIKNLLITILKKSFIQKTRHYNNYTTKY